ncbi:hypothetical protein C6P44_000156 [Monosporozyma unispora]|nr:hypothetical protein C6P44_000156 [Kazachstania unispora]
MDRNCHTKKLQKKLTGKTNVGDNIFIAIFVPPIAVWLKRGLCSKDFLINLLLFLLGFIPGLIHALYIISKYPYEENRIRLSDTDINNNTNNNDNTGYGTIA